MFVSFLYHHTTNPSEVFLFLFFFFNDTATTEIYTLSLHDALPITLGRFDVGVLRNRKRHEQLLGLGILLFEIAERDDHEDVHARAEEQSLVVFKHADDLVDAPVDTHGFPYRVRVWEKRFADGRAQHHHRTRVLFVKRAEEAAALDGE